jgi:hypothetical protein
MRIIRQTELIPTPWKNGGGITRNIAQHTDAQGLLWRLSMADVDSAGDFSSFAGLTRILTVIKGSGMVLHSEGAAWPADFAVPVTFDGAAPVRATLAQGPVRDFNLMFDTARCEGSARCRTQTGAHTLGLTGQTGIVHVIHGTLTLSERAQVLGTGDTVISDTAPLEFALGADTCVLAITLQPRP